MTQQTRGKTSGPVRAGFRKWREPASLTDSHWTSPDQKLSIYSHRLEELLEDDWCTGRVAGR